MEKTQKKNRIILVLCSIFILIASIFSFISLVKNNKMVVKADTVTMDYSYNGSNISSKTTFTNGLFSYNLFDINASRVIQGGHTYVVDNTIITVDPGGSTELDAVFGLIPVKENTTYYIGANASNKRLLFRIYDENKNVITSAIPNWTYNQYWKGSFHDFGTTDIRTQLIIPQGAKYLAFCTAWLGFQVTVSNLIISEYNVVDNYQPYQNSTQLNYEFDFNSFTDFDSSFYVDQIDLFSNISNNMDFTRVSNTDYSYNYGNTYSFSTNTRGLVTKLTYSAIDTSTNILNNDYMFNLYIMIDYIDNTDYNPALFLTADIGSIVLGSYLDYPTYFRNEYTDINNFISTQKYNFISFNDKYNNNLNIFIPLDSDIDSDYWKLRTYFVADESDYVFSAGYNSGYFTGYNNGFNDGNVDGDKNGYNRGYNIGYNVGYGYGVEAGNDYSFLSLVSAVIDAPMTYFQSLFNFELLGVNLQGFLMALFTLCVVVTIVKLCLGR